MIIRHIKFQRQWMSKSLSMRYLIFTILMFLIPNKDRSTRSALVFLNLKGAFEPSLGMIMAFYHLYCDLYLARYNFGMVIRYLKTYNFSCYHGTT